jgi:hypothetical protein
MGIFNEITARDLSGQPDSHSAGDRLHYGAGQIALRIFGADTPENRAIIFRWQNSPNPALKPPFLIKVGRHIAAWESAIRRHAEGSFAGDH